MIQNPELMVEYRRALRKTKGRAHDELLEAMELYEVACVLSQGANPDRCAHWERRAIAAECRLATLVDRGISGAVV